MVQVATLKCYTYLTWSPSTCNSQPGSRTQPAWFPAPGNEARTQHTWKIGLLLGRGSGLVHFIVLLSIYVLALFKQLQCCMEVDRLEFLSSQFYKICSTGRPCRAALLFKCLEVGDSPLYRCFSNMLLPIITSCGQCLQSRTSKCSACL